ncbi:hypothetical protein LQZ19_06795 [Treponema primitia]|uniref:hypothetical protein n=1 Tax=Treponema primitia TaxID=88058 RepID=UPI003980E9E4
MQALAITASGAVGINVLLFVQLGGIMYKTILILRDRKFKHAAAAAAIILGCFLPLFLTGCGETQPVTLVSVEYKNSSSHRVTVTLRPGSFTLNPNANKTVTYINGGTEIIKAADDAGSHVKTRIHSRTEDKIYTDSEDISATYDTESYVEFLD